MNEYDPDIEYDENVTWLSTCCGARPWGEIEYGICSRCKDHCSFEQEDESEEI